MLGDLNAEPTSEALYDFCQVYGCSNIVKENICYKNPENPSCVDLIITNRPISFKGTKTIETGLSDFHKMSLTIMKVFYKKQKANVIRYRSYRNFDNEAFIGELQVAFSDRYNDTENLSFSTFKNVIDHSLKKHAPLKKRYVRANQAPLINKKINKEIMKRSRLRNKFLNSKSDVDHRAYNKQRNLCVSLIRKEKKSFFSNLNTKDINENKTFWKTVKPLFTEKVKINSKITLIEEKVISKQGEENIIEEEIISDEQKIAEVFNDFFINIIPNLKISIEQNINHDFTKTDDPVSNAINKFENHPSIVMIKRKNNRSADVTPAYKKKSKNSKDYYRPISILSNISEIYERCLYDQIQNFFENILSKYQCGFRKGYNAQHCLITLIEKWKKGVDNGGSFGALMTDLSKAFDCLSHELLIAKLDAYGFDNKSLKLIYNCLSNRKQRVKINESFSSWEEILYGVPQGSILEPLLFSIFICDMFYFLEDHEIANYADDSTPFSAQCSHQAVIEDLEKSSAILFNWLKSNYMKVNTDKSHLLLSGNIKLTKNIDNNIIESEEKQELLDVIIDSRLTFEEHVNNLCKKASQKLNALARISSYMDIPKQRIIFKSFITSQFR